ncbi:hydroxymethylbilane synthase [Tessaracoccus sp. Z1128]
MKFRLGTRASALALARSEMVAATLREAGHEVEIVPVASAGQDTVHMPDGYSQGVFAMELRDALRAHEVDVVVHSVKDIPLSDKPQDLTIPAVLPRGDHRDVLCTRGGVTLAALPRHSRVGVTSLRRIAQLRALRPDLTFVDVGGSLEERLRHLEPGDLDAVVLSAAGVETLGLADRIAEYLPILTAPGQGALALECRRDDDDIVAALKGFDDIETRICIDAERAVLVGLGTTYMAPVGALASRRGILSLKAGVFAIDGTKRNVLEVGLPTSEFHAVRTGENAAAALKERRAERFFSPEALASVKLSAEHDDESPFIEVPGDDRIRVLLPRQEGRLAQALRKNGLRVDCVSLQEAKLISADNILGWADWVVLPSAQTVWALRERGWEIPANTRVAAMGSTTQLSAEDGGITVHLAPEGTASSQKLVEMFPVAQGQERVVIACADQLSTNLENGLRAKGYTVERLEIYTMVDVDSLDPRLTQMWSDGAWQAILLTQPSLASAYVNLLGHRDGVHVLAWDEPTAKTLGGLGVPVLAVAKSKDEFGVAALARELVKRR